jgi:transcriptional regulator with XRE-family HTH domain
LKVVLSAKSYADKEKKVQPPDLDFPTTGGDSMAGTLSRTRRADARDAEIGRRIRARRTELGMSQTELGGKIGVSFQQLQKYELGMNRIGAGRLQRVCEGLRVPVTFFYDPQPALSSDAQSNPTGLFEYLQRRDAVLLVTSFHNIREPGLRRALVEVVTRLGNAESAPARRKKSNQSRSR